MLENVIISTLAGSIICIVLLMFKNKILSILGGKALYYISLFAMLSFILPLNIGEVNLPKIPAQQEVKVTELNTAAPLENTNAEPEQREQHREEAEERYSVLPETSDTVRRSNPITMQEILTAVWLLGFIISLFRYFISYFRFKRKICRYEVTDKINGVRIIKNPVVTSPMIFGFFKPTLAIPEIDMNEEDYNLAVRHEMTHYKHCDAWLKLYAVIINSVCWFNPITYLMLNLIGEACEYACDEAVTRDMDAEDKKQYSTMILSFICQTSPSLTSNMVKSKKQLRRRFEMIMKKKRASISATVMIIALIISFTVGSIAFANGMAPVLSAFLKDDYVYVSTYGNNGYSYGYNDFVPVEKNGEYYLPLREFMNQSDVENDKIKYDNGVITVELWTKERNMVAFSFNSGSSEATPVAPNDGQPTLIPSKFSWSTSCKIGSRDVDIAGKKHTLENAPYMDGGVTYVPYEYLKKLKQYEDIAMNSVSLKDRREVTSKFNALMLYGFNSENAECYSDYIQIEKLVGTDFFSSITTNGNAKIAKTGYRTEFEASFDYLDLNTPGKTGSIRLILNKVIRIYSKGSDLEGLFTVEMDGKTVYDNYKGNIIQLPVSAGEGVLAFPITRVKVGDLKLNIFFAGHNMASKEYDEKAREVGKMSELSDTEKSFIIPSYVKLNGINVTRGSKMYSHLWINKEKGLIDANIQFDNFNGDNGEEMEFYRIHTEVGSEITVIDGSTISAEMYFTEGNNYRIDSFDALITFLPEEGFELKSTDGKYIIKGRAEGFVPQWQWSEEQQNSPVPQVTMVD